MKLKSLVVPFLLFLCVVLTIWWINPSYAELKMKKASLAEASARLEDMRKKNDKAAQLEEVWNKSAEERNVIMTYVPEQQQEEDAINSLNILTSQAGLRLYNLSVSEEKSAVPATPVNLNIDIASENTVQAEPVVSNLKITLGVFGDYGKIKNLLNKIVTLKRFNSISELKISKAGKQDAVAGVNEGTNGNLQADIVVNFVYLKKERKIISINDNVFVSGKFDLTIADVIAKKLATEVNAVNVELAGRENPFVR